MPEQGFLHQALIYLAAGVVVVPVFKRLGLGSVLGYLVAGTAIGPWGLALVTAPEAILHFAEFGVVLLLFLVGLELNPRRVWQLRKPIFGMGAVQVLVTTAVVALIAWALGVAPKVALVAGMGFAMSSTAIGLASLQEKNLLPTPGGQASFSVLRYVANTRQREIFVGFALMLVIGVAALMELVGLSTALGAFLGGVLLADSEYRHTLELDIEPFKGLLLGLFFIAVGMSVDLGLFVRSPVLIFFWLQE